MKKQFLATALLASFSVGVLAETPSFNFIEIGKTEIDIDGVPITPDGYELDMNFELSEDYFLNAEYASVDASGVEMKMTNVGFGYKSEISDSTVFFSQIDFTNVKGDGGYDENGYRIGAGVRSNLTKELEVTGVYEYLDVDDSTSIYTLGAAYQFTDQFAFYTDYKIESDANQLSIGARFSF